jgi:hypothetical protein
MAENEATLLIRIKQMGAEILDRLVITAGDVVDAFKSIAQFVGQAIDAFREEEKAINKLTNTMVNQGVYTQDLKASYVEMASALQKLTTFGDEEIINAQAILQAYSKNVVVTEDLVRATLDLAAGKEMDLASAAEAVGKAVAGETNTLARLKLEVNDNSTAGERYAAVLAKIDGQFKGNAITNAQGLGSIEQMKNAWSDFMEMMGRLSAPFVQGLVSMTTSVLNFFNALAGPNLDTAKMEEIEKRIASIRHQIELMNKARIGPDAVAGLQKELDEMLALQEQMNAKQAQSDENNKEKQLQNRIDKRAMNLEQDLLDEEQKVNQQSMSDTQALTAQLALDNAKIANATTTQQKMQALAEKAYTVEGLQKAKQAEADKKLDAEKVKNRTDTLNTISTLQSSNNKALAFAGKAAGITQIAIDTPVAIGKAMAAFPPPFNFVAAGLVGAAMAAQASRIAGIALADGGVVMPRPGGTQATIGEAGQAEAVIPLDRMGEFGMGGGTTINFNGPIMGNDAQAEEFARAIDRQLLKLRRSNQSMAFDTDVI